MNKILTLAFALVVTHIAVPVLAAGQSFHKAICYQGPYVPHAPADIFEIELTTAVAGRIKSEISPGASRFFNEWAAMKNIMLGGWTEVRLLKATQGDPKRSDLVTQLDFTTSDNLLNGNAAHDEKRVLHCTVLGPELLPAQYR